MLRAHACVLVCMRACGLSFSLSLSRARELSLSLSLARELSLSLSLRAHTQICVECASHDATSIQSDARLQVARPLAHHLAPTHETGWRPS